MLQILTYKRDEFMAKPVAQLGSSESVNSASWLTNNSIVAGMGFKFIRVFDIRG
jgi:hypothetical protein